MIDLNSISIQLGLRAVLLSCFMGSAPLWAQENLKQGDNLELSPEIIESSPVLQRWQQKIPDVLEEIETRPSFPTRIRLGYSQFPSNNHVGGINVGVEDIFIEKTHLTLSGHYYRDLGAGGDRLSVGGDLQYYLLPLGSYVNVAPVVGYRYLTTDGDRADGANLGVRLVFALSPGGGADVFVTQSFVAPGSNQEVGITNISAAYALTDNFRLATDIQWQNSRQQPDTRIGINWEWIFSRE